MGMWGLVFGTPFAYTHATSSQAGFGREHQGALVAIRRARIARATMA